MTNITESNIETFAFEILQKLGWEYVPGLAIAPGVEYAERERFEQIILTPRLRKAVARLNRDVPVDAQELAVQKVLCIYSPDMLHNNETLTRLRDVLLPKLMGGEVMVKLEQQVGGL